MGGAVVRGHLVGEGSVVVVIDCQKGTVWVLGERGACLLGLCIGIMFSIHHVVGGHWVGEGSIVGKHWLPEGQVVGIGWERSPPVNVVHWH